MAGSSVMSFETRMRYCSIWLTWPAAMTGRYACRGSHSRECSSSGEGDMPVSEDKVWRIIFSSSLGIDENRDSCCGIVDSYY